MEKILKELREEVEVLGKCPRCGRHTSMRVKNFGTQVCEHCLRHNYVVFLGWVDIRTRKVSVEPLTNLDFAALYRDRCAYENPLD